jgi:catechol 2,3-dioxygenase
MDTTASAQSATAKIFNPRRLGHANLWVKDLKKSEDFYNATCGLAIEFWEPGLKATFLGTGNTPHDLGMIEVTGGKARYGRDGILMIPEGIGLEPGLNHLAWELENEAELVDAYKRAKSANIVMAMTVDHQVAHSIYMFDPDGNQIEFYCDTVKDWRKVLHGEMDLITGNWTPGETKPFTDSLYELNPPIREVANAPMHPRRVTHAVLLTDDLDGLARFYTSVGGLDVAHRSKGAVWLRGSQAHYRCNLAILKREPGQTKGYHHVSFDLVDVAAVEAAEEALNARGIKPEKSIDNEWKRSFFVLDPDGLRSQYVTYKRSGYGDVDAAPAAERPFLM